MEKYCSVAATVNARAKIDYGYEIIEGLDRQDYLAEVLSLLHA